jgi:hypothetical protein
LDNLKVLTTRFFSSLQRPAWDDRQTKARRPAAHVVEDNMPGPVKRGSRDNRDNLIRALQRELIDAVTEKTDLATAG